MYTNDYVELYAICAEHYAEQSEIFCAIEEDEWMYAEKNET